MNNLLNFTALSEWLADVFDCETDTEKFRLACDAPLSSVLLNTCEQFCSNANLLKLTPGMFVQIGGCHMSELDEHFGKFFEVVRNRKDDRKVLCRRPRTDEDDYFVTFTYDQLRFSRILKKFPD